MATSSNPNLSAATKEWLDSFNATPDLYADVPQEMKDSPTWVVWRYEINAKGKKDKPPSNARDIDGPHASTTDPTTWVSFDEAVDVANRRDDIKGLGYVFQKDFQGSDLDGAVQTINGALVITPFARSIGKLAGSYCEFSPSRTGIHLIWKSPIPLPEGHKKGNHDLGGEIYDKDSPRYFTVTGDKVPDLSTDSIRTITDPNTIKLLHFLTLNTTNEKFVRLWTGAWQKATDAHGIRFQSQSEADLSLCDYLVRGGFNTTETLDAAFRQSGLMRDDWNHKSKYTIPKALSGKEVNADPNATGKKLFLNLAFHSDPVEKIKGREYVLGPNVGESFGLFRRGQVSLISGSSGGGKTSLINQLLVAQKLGADFLGYKTHGYSFVLLSRDRNQDAHEETMARMHLALEIIPFKRLPKNVWDIDAAQAIVNQIEEIHPLPTIVFIEGIDMLLGEPGIKAATYFSGLLEDIAQHFQMTLICSIGSPKTKEGQGYPAGRDNILGSSGWGRTIDTLWWMQFTKDGDTSPQRYLTIYPRNAGAKKFTLEFVEGNLEICPDRPEDTSHTKNKKTAEEIDWYQQQHQLAKIDPTKKWWTVVDAEEALDLKRRTAERHIENHTLKKYLIKKPGEKQGRGTPEQYRWNDLKTNPLSAKESQPVEPELNF
jgi:hypothetical protein